MRQKALSLFWITIMMTLFNHQADAQETMRIVFLGDSLTAGYALNADQAYPALIQERIDEAGLPFRVLNSGISGDTTAGGLSRIDWLLRQPMDLLVIALGANDGLRAFDPDITKSNLTAIIESVRENRPSCRIKLIGMKLPRNMGDDYVRSFERIYREIAGAYEIDLLPFLLEGVAGHPELNLPDGIHPTAEGQKVIAENVWNFLEPSLRRMAEERRTAE